ncbi:MAG: F0F1 ATP synthase subunit B [Halanaerobiales bacterium]
MQINWFEIIAQVINFFILLFILQKLFYKPVTEAMKERKSKIQDKREKADEKMNEANELIDKYEQKMESLEDEKEEIIEKAEQEAAEKRDELFEQYREEAEKKRRDYLNEVEEEKERFLENVRIELGKNAVRIASNVLKMVADEDLIDKSLKLFIDRLDSIDRENIKEEVEYSKEKVTLYSSHQLEESSKEKIEERLDQLLEGFEEIDYQIEEDLILGYRLKLESLTVDYSIVKYLDQVEKNIEEIITNV